MKRLSILVSALLLSVACHAQRFLTEVFPSVNKTANVVYDSNFSVLSGAPVMTKLTMDVYEPAGTTDTMGRRPLIILLHSGTFLPPYINTQLEGGRNDSGLVWMCNSFAKRGYVVANIDYRLGWNPAGSNVDIRRGTLITAFIRAIQDVKACARYFRKDAGATNTYKIDSSKVIVGGPATGGALAVNYGALLNQSQLSIPKFTSNITDATYGFVTGQPYVNPAVMGDLDGFGGMSTMNNPNHTPGNNGKANFIFSWEAIVGDSSWVVAGLPPMVSFHRVNNASNQPYLHGMVYVLIGTPQPVVDVSGSGFFIPRTNLRGNNACFNPNTFTDAYTTKAMSLSGGQEGLYPLMDSLARMTWWDSTASVTECQLYGKTAAQCNAIWAAVPNPTNKAKSLTYLDTLMNYLNPRIVKCLNLPTGAVGVGVNPIVEGISIYPNPTKGVVTIEAPTAIQSIAVKDLTGKTLWNANFGHDARVQLYFTNLPVGVYLITVQTTKAVITHRLLLD